MRDYFQNNQLNPLPIRDSVKKFKANNVKYDLKAAINVALLALPQGMAYAAIADLPIANGILCSAIAAIIAPFFASSRHTILGPTNATSLMLFSFFVSAGLTDTEKLGIVPIVILLVGIFSILGALFKVAELLQYISRSVLVGYITGAATLIMVNQFKHLLGVAHTFEGGKALNFFGVINTLSRNILETQWLPLLIGVTTLSLYLLLQKKKKNLPNFALILIMASALVYGLREWTQHASFDRLPYFSSFGLEALKPALPSLPEGRNLFDVLSQLTGISLAVAFLASLENTGMAKSLASRSGDRPDLNQDMLSVGMTNIAASALGGMPASGSLTRSALNFESGAKTRFASIYCGLLCLGALFLLALFPLVQYIPKTVLAALVIGIAFSLINLKNIRICLSTTVEDAVVIILTFICTLLIPLHFAIFVGVLVSIMLFLRKVSKPHLVEYEMSEQGTLQEIGAKHKRPNPAISIVHVEGSLFFGAAELFRTQVQRTAADPNLKVIILRLKNARHLDATSVIALDDLVKEMRKSGRHVIISGANRDVYKVLKKSRVLETLQEGCQRREGETNVFLYSPRNPNLSTRDALLRAQDLLGTKKADIKIFYDPAHDAKK